ncbi:MAG: cell envelope biogenesis protein OmpA [Bacteriovoracaceae bacterium]
MSKIFSIILLFSLIGCSSRPKLYPNHKLKTVGKEASQKDIDKCIADAENYLESSKGKQVAKGAGAGAIIGGAMGAVSGLFTGNLGRGLLRGSAVGAAGGGAVGALSPDQIKRNYVNQCLGEKGYQVIGWD